MAEDSGLIVELGEFVLRTACRAGRAQWRESGAPDLRLTVNVSARQMALCGIPGTVGAALRETGLAPTALGLEITEGLLLEDVADTAETLGALRAMGVRLMLDDFGTGFSSLGYLRRYPIDLIKIDRSFVNDLGEDGAGDAAIVEAIVGMAKALGMGVIPEGVETEGQLERLIGLGCDFAQGFHLGRPMPAAEHRPAAVSTRGRALRGPRGALVRARHHRGRAARARRAHARRRDAPGRGAEAGRGRALRALLRAAAQGRRLLVQRLAPVVALPRRRPGRQARR